jgi:hypothetical protein
MILSLRCVKGIFFVRFTLPMGDKVIIRAHGEACAMNAGQTPPPSCCECLPPKARVEPKLTAEYDCDASITGTYPPVPPDFLLQYFNSEDERPELDPWIVGLLPKRRWGELWGRPNQPAEGWGIYYKEGWDPDTIVLFAFVLLSASLLFGVLWTTVRDDIQGAFGLSSWMVAMGGAMMAVIATQAESG